MGFLSDVIAASIRGQLGARDDEKRRARAFLGNSAVLPREAPSDRPTFDVLSLRRRGKDGAP